MSPGAVALCGCFASATFNYNSAKKFTDPVINLFNITIFNEDQYIVKTQSDRRPDLVYESLKKNVMLDHVDPL